MTTSRIKERAPVFILINPQMAENIGMAARAMLNCGIHEMRLVSPREDHLSDKAISASSGSGTWKNPKPKALLTPMNSTLIFKPST